MFIYIYPISMFIELSVDQPSEVHVPLPHQLGHHLRAVVVEHAEGSHRQKVD